MKKFITKFISDTLQVKGKWSMKRILVAICFPDSLYIAHTIVNNDNINVHAIVVLQTIYAFITAVLITTAYSKTQEVKNEITNETE